MTIDIEEVKKKYEEYNKFVKTEHNKMHTIIDEIIAFIKLEIENVKEIYAGMWKTINDIRNAMHGYDYVNSSDWRLSAEREFIYELSNKINDLLNKKN